MPIFRNLATITTRRPQTSFTDNLNSGPSLSDFLTSSTEPTSIPGTSHLPDWLKRPIPAGGNFAKIKKDLRGLNLHTGNCP
jgi:lipoyl synthase